MEREQLRHRALSSPVRARLLALLRDAAEPLDVEWLAGELDLHPNTVRSHLRVLAEAGLVGDETEPRMGRGRPRRVYRALAAQVVGDSGYRFLAEVLAGRLATDVPDAAGAASDAGTVWGRRLVEEPVPGQRLSSEQAVERLTTLLARLGFEPSVDTAASGAIRVELLRCPFREVARNHPEVTCAVHGGIMRGALQELGGNVVLGDLERSTDAGPCVASLQVAS